MFTRYSTTSPVAFSTYDTSLDPFVYIMTLEEYCEVTDLAVPTEIYVCIQ
jgi:hypothetical protein